MKLHSLWLVAALASVSSAFDGSKEGFVLGFGVGVHNNSFKETFDLGYTSVSGSDSKSGLATDFLVGYGFTPHFMVFYENTNSWYWGNGYTYYDAVGPVGIRYYVNGDDPGPFFGASGILGSFENVSKSAGAGGAGGFSFTLGYEFAKHVSLEAKYLHVDASDGGFNHTSNAFQALIEGMAF